MTTTVRPSGPLAHTPDGGRSRAFLVCDNGRPVGELRLSAEGPTGGSTGWIAHLSVEEGARRRGRATVAALAAEEILRGWGCVRLAARVPASATAGLALASALGYAESRRTMVKSVTGQAPPPPAEGSSLRPMSAAEFSVWLAEDRARMIADGTGRGLTPEEAARRVDDGHRRLLPEGVATTGAALRVLTRADVPGRVVGSLWVALAERLPPGMDGVDGAGYVYAVAVAADQRGRGHGRALMEEAERLCRDAGLGRVGLSVAADNAVARRLYDALGYRTRELHLSKPLLG
ncbi:GNAT family N-acetyltransferase [Streptomyces sp. 4N509B]|uniref:GNAT family N-acetyltransferase n=1 Tax=Streptomyces sp. 4N509B TaxID=3457413 RepID=UPI003FD31A55